MLWVIESNVADEERYDAFISAIASFGIDYQIVTRIPFSQELVPEITSEDVFAYGSVGLINKVASTRGWKVFTNDNFDFEVWSKAWDGDVLNEGAEIGPFNSVPINEEQFFIRPTKDNKAFTGKIMSIIDYYNWLDQLKIGEESSLGLDFDIEEQVMVAPVRNIYQETRFFVVDGKIVTHSLYRTGGRILYRESSETDPEAVEFAQRMIDRWTPDDAFVLDLALTDDGYKVLEINSINCSGFYKSDVTKLVAAFVDHFKVENNHVMELSGL